MSAGASTLAGTSLTANYATHCPAVNVCASISTLHSRTGHMNRAFDKCKPYAPLTRRHFRCKPCAPLTRRHNNKALSKNRKWSQQPQNSPRSMSLNNTTMAAPLGSAGSQASRPCSHTVLRQCQEVSVTRRPSAAGSEPLVRHLTAQQATWAFRPLGTPLPVQATCACARARQSERRRRCSEQQGDHFVGDRARVLCPILAVLAAAARVVPERAVGQQQGEEEHVEEG